MRYLFVIIALVSSVSAFGQHGRWSVEDSLKGEAILNTIDQSLMMFYAENSSDNNYDSIIAALNFEADDIPSYSDEVYCERLSVMNSFSLSQQFL